MKLLIWIVCLILSTVTATAADGFKEFEFGDSVQTTINKGEDLCRFGKEQKNTRWSWISEIECTDYLFNGNIKVKLYFQFADDELVKIYVVSRNIKNYFLIRKPDHNYLVPRSSKDSRKNLANLADQLLFKDKVHQLGDEYRYTTFFFDGQWEWEYYYVNKGYEKSEKDRKNDLLEDESEGGVKGWKKFNFGDQTSVIKEKLQGMCSSLQVTSGQENSEMLLCQDFLFLDKKIVVLFLFQSAELVKIELLLTPDWYETLLPLLKKKYGTPYSELTENRLYYPYIEFPKANIVLNFKRSDNSQTEINLVLKYLKEGYQDEDLFKLQEEKKVESPKTKEQGKTEKILESI